MYHRNKFYPELVSDPEKFNIETTVTTDDGNSVVLVKPLSMSDEADFNPSFKHVNVQSFTLENKIKSGSPLKPSPSIMIGDMELVDRVNKVFNEKISKK